MLTKFHAPSIKLNPTRSVHAKTSILTIDLLSLINNTILFYYIQSVIGDWMPTTGVQSEP